MPEAGEYILASVGFSPASEPFVVLQKDSTHIRFNPVVKILTLRFNTSTRYCTGWYDLASGTHAVCPEAVVVDSAYTQCPACQKRTGFNPAFYNANSVSSQQEARNAEPHMLYLAHFGKGVVKVGITHAARNIARLLEQGARSALILDTFPTANIARHYEAKIAALSGIAEMIQHRKKQDLLRIPYDSRNAEEELYATLDRIQSALGIAFDRPILHTLNAYYFPTKTPPLSNLYDSSPHSMTSGLVLGMVATTLITSHQESVVGFPMKKFVGYKVTLTQDEQAIPMSAQQMTLF